MTREVQRPYGISVLDAEFWQEIWRAIQRILGLCILIVAHWGLQRLLKWSFVDFHEYAKVEHLATTMSLAAFGVIYALLLWDMVTIFLPVPTLHFGRREQ